VESPLDRTLARVRMPRLRLPHVRPPTLEQLMIAFKWGLAVVGVKLVLEVLRATTDLKLDTPVPVVLLGVIVGMTYGLLSVGLVLIYRTNRIINFAHGQIGAFGAAFFGLAAVKWQIPYWLAFPIALLIAAGVGYTAETAVVRRLRNAPRLMSVVATLGVGQFLVVFALVINAQAAAGSVYPVPPGLPTFNVGALVVTPAYTGMLLLSPLAVLAIATFLRVSKYGLAMRAASSNPEAARMAGIFEGRMSGLAWGIAGALSAFSAILTQPTSGFTSGDTFGPALLLRAMAGAVIARMSSIPQALAAGIGLGVLEQLLLWNYPQAGLVEVSLFLIILVALLVQKQRGGREEEKGSWASVQALPPVPDTLRRIWLVRHLGTAAGLIALVVTAGLPFLISNTHATQLVGIMGFSIIGLSVVILTGLAGQLTLGQFAVGAVGAVVSFYVSSRTGNFPLSILYGGLTAGAVSVILGLPALRIRGLMLTVTTLSFALVMPVFVLSQVLDEAGVDPGRPIMPGNHPLDTGQEYYWFAFALLLIAMVLARNIQRSGFGRLLIAVRDNEDNARAFTVRASLVKAQGYLLAGFIAGVGGAAYGHSLSSIGADAFPAKASIDVVVMTVIGGVAVLFGPILGALVVIGLPTFVPLGSLALAATYLGQLIIILYLPGGLASVVGRLRDRLIRRIARANGVDYDAAYAEAERRTDDDESPAALAQSQPVGHTRPDRLAPVLLDAAGLNKSFGGVHAVRDVSIEVREGETVGLIGPNGAGKTTTFEVLGGFVSADSGSVRFLDRDITDLSPEARARMGLIRSFQDAALFPTMTVTECVMLALERVRPTSFLVSITGWNGGERRKRQLARQLISYLGLDAYRDKQIRELSTGTRRITEIACLVALEPKFLLLDEPSSGIAQRETEALGGLLEKLKRELGLTLLVIEHDMPLIMGISDRIVAMADGRVICSGTPAEVMADPLVAEAYLGGNVRAVERSGARSEPEPLVESVTPR
jgi:ABC-type branched-subunit amino acid transport system ATPase component/ABC-type branched-subunit amino acid transport system permease subunit